MKEATATLFTQVWNPRKGLKIESEEAKIVLQVLNILVRDLASI